jgi:hypothetical protein
MKDLFKFERLVGISSLFIASCAAFFSIIGIGRLFSGSALASMIMASSLEIGKLVATSFLYRYWTKTKLLLKIYLISAVVILMIITSFGVFGYLTSAYQQSAIESKLAEDKILVINDQKKYTEDKINSAKKRIESIVALRNSQESRLSESMTNVVISRNPIQLAQIQEQTKELIDKSEKDIESENAKIQKGIDELQSFDKKIAEIKMESGSKKDIQTFKFISEQFNVNMNTGVTWFIVALISVFDPLAICLLLAYNTTLNFTDKVEKPKEKDDIKIYQHQDSVTEPEENVESIVEQAKKEAQEEVKNEKIIKEIVTEIKEVPVEKIVEKEVIREVPSNKGPHFSF